MSSISEPLLGTRGEHGGGNQVLLQLPQVGTKKKKVLIVGAGAAGM